MKELKTAAPQAIADFQSQNPGWQILKIDGESRLQREYSFPDFQAALDFTNRVGAIAETENHHPSITTEYGKVIVGWWTHTIKNISAQDLIMAAKTDAIFVKS